MKFLVCALFYGDHPGIAQRCATTLAALRATGRVDMCIGLNEVAPATRALLDTWLPGVQTVAADPQIHKYPMMRRLVHAYTGDATHLMWWDDDSCLKPNTDTPAWLDAAEHHAAACPGAIGAPWSVPMPDVLWAWTQQQPWFAQRARPAHVAFPSGAWFAAPLALLRRFDWPPRSLRHNGGDMAFGALLHQQNLPVRAFRAGLAINADDSLVESSAPRRGFSERPLGI